VLVLVLLQSSKSNVVTTLDRGVVRQLKTFFGQTTTMLLLEHETQPSPVTNNEEQ
jgi:hypothetical protein